MTRPAQLRKESFSTEGLGSARMPETAYGQAERQSAEARAGGEGENPRGALRAHLCRMRAAITENTPDSAHIQAKKRLRKGRLRWYNVPAEYKTGGYDI